VSSSPRLLSLFSLALAHISRIGHDPPLDFQNFPFPLLFLLVAFEARGFPIATTPFFFTFLLANFAVHLFTNHTNSLPSCAKAKRNNECPFDLVCFGFPLEFCAFQFLFSHNHDFPLFLFFSIVAEARRVVSGVETVSSSPCRFAVLFNQ